MISITVLAIGILGLLQAFPRGLATDKQLEYQAMAAEIGQAKMEELAALPYDSLPPGSLENQVRLGSDPAALLYNFFRSTNITLVDQNLNANASDIGLKKITVTIYWPATLGGGQKQFSLSTLISKR